MNIKLFRHGERTPLTFYKNDPWKDDKYWDEKPGELTNVRERERYAFRSNFFNVSSTQVGRQQPFELGLYMRQKYAGFLSSTFDENEVYAQSSNISRTIMSAESFLAGMFSPENPAMQSFPVHTTPRKLDNLIHANTKCEAWTKHFDAVMESDEIKEFNRKHAALYEYLSLHSGDTIQKMADTVSIQDTLMIEAIHNRR